jgi:hypothetical protein
MQPPDKPTVNHVQEDESMDFNKFFSIVIFLLVVFVTGCMSSIDKFEKEELEDLRKSIKHAPVLVPGSERQPCCIDILITDTQARDIFNKMPGSTLLTAPTKGTCLSSRLAKINQGLMCTAIKSNPNDPESYWCKMTIDYTTGTMKKIDVNEYLNCDDNQDDEEED